MTLAVLIPSLPFRLGLFQFYTLSWFHLYVAAGSAVAALALAYLTPSKRSYAVLAAVAVVLLLPLARQFMIARAFLGGTIARLDSIDEMRSLAFMASTADTRFQLTEMYSALVWLVPLTAGYCIWQAWRERATPRLFFWVCSILGLALLLSQLRMHYFGSFALYLPLLVLAQECITRWPDRDKVVALLATMVFALMYWLPGRYQLAGETAIGGDPAFVVLWPILADLKRACDREPGIVLADNDAGHYIRYSTQCSVIANNFLLTPQHEQKIRQLDYLMSLPASALPGVAPFVRYVLVRRVTIMREHNEVAISGRKAQLTSDLLLQPLEKVPSSYVLIQQANVRAVSESAEQSEPLIRLFKVNPVAPRASAASSLASSLKHVDK
jgi:hypothetical protein